MKDDTLYIERILGIKFEGGDEDAFIKKHLEEAKHQSMQLIKEQMDNDYKKYRG